MATLILINAETRQEVRRESIGPEARYDFFEACRDGTLATIGQSCYRIRGCRWQEATEQLEILAIWDSSVSCDDCE